MNDHCDRMPDGHLKAIFNVNGILLLNTTKGVLVVSVAVPVHENCRTAVLVLVLEFSSSHPHSVFTVYSTSFDSTVHALLNLTVLQCLNTHRMSYALTIMRHLPVACDCTKVHPSRRTC